MIVLCDFDGVIADTTGEVIRRYNMDYDDNLTNDDIKDWYTHKFVKPACGKRVYRYYKTDDIYLDVKPIEGALETIKKIREEHRLVIVTSGLSKGKVKWMQRYGLIEDDFYDPDLIFAHDKNLIQGDVLVDDRIENCMSRVSILFDQPWNRHAVLMGRAVGWEDVMKRLMYVEA